MTESAYTKVREAFRRALPNKVTATWIMTNVDGYRTEPSARSLMAYLRQFGLIDENGAPTDVAKQWRLDETYSASCEVLLRNAYPADMVEAVSGSVPSSDVLVRLFMNHGFGLGSAKNLSRIFRLIASKEVPMRVAAPPNGGTSKASKAPKRTRDGGASEGNSTLLADAPQIPSEPAMAVLRYFLERGREKKRLFAHLKIDLLDEVSQGE
jgi:hypothetical protein